MSNKKKWMLRLLKIVGIALIVVVAICVFYYLLQRYWAHRDGYFVPSYEQVELTEDSDYETIFLQTGLGKSAVDKLIANGDFQTILDAQESFFHPPKAECEELLGWFTREDRLVEDSGVEPELIDIQPGDILISLSTHSFGWHHGHAAIAISRYSTLESAVMGTDSSFGSVNRWKEYSNFAVLRIKDVTEEQQQALVEYRLEYLEGVPYDLLVGILGDKAPDVDDESFGLQCSYLAWYAWYQFGYDLDSDGGKIVTPHDILHSDLVEIVQIYGMDPYQFIEETEE